VKAGGAPSSLIFSSAARSRSMVETPGATMARTISSTWRTMRPLRRIFSSSDCDLQLIIASTLLFNQQKHLCSHLLHGEFAIDFKQTALPAVIIHQRQGLTLITFQTFGDDLFRAIFTLDERGIIEVASAFAMRGVKINVVNSPTGGTRTPAGKPLQ